MSVSEEVSATGHRDDGYDALERRLEALDALRASRAVLECATEATTTPREDYYRALVACRAQGITLAVLAANLGLDESRVSRLVRQARKSLGDEATETLGEPVEPVKKRRKGKKRGTGRGATGTPGAGSWPSTGPVGGSAGEPGSSRGADPR